MTRTPVLILLLGITACERPAPSNATSADTRQVTGQRGAKPVESKPDIGTAIGPQRPAPQQAVPESSSARTGQSRGPLEDVTGPFELLPAMDRVLRDSIPSFRVWSLEHYDVDVQTWIGKLQNVPWAVFADFNNDNTPDVVVDGTDGERDLRVALVSTPSSYRLLVLDSRPLSEDLMHDSIEFLVYQAPGRLDTLACGGEPYICHDEPFDLQTEAFQVAWFEKASVLWYWNGDGFASAGTSD